MFCARRLCSSVPPAIAQTTLSSHSCFVSLIYSVARYSS